MPVLNAITVDVEDFFHAEAMSTAAARETWDLIPSRVEKSTNQVLELFAKHKVRGTFFLLGWVAEKFPTLVRDILQQGHEIACHSFWHRAVFRLSPEQFREDTSRAKNVIEQVTGTRVFGYRAPSFSMIPGTEWASVALADLGFVYDSSVNPIVHDFYGNAAASRGPSKVAAGRLTELPIATVRVCANNLPVGGGAYLRILPYKYLSWGVRRVNDIEKRPAMIYFHPWELDSTQPRFDVGFKSGLRHYTNLGKMEGKLERLLKEFRFGRVIEAFAADLGFSATPTKIAAAGKL